MNAGSDRLTGTLGKLTVRDIVVMGGALLCVIASLIPRYVASSTTGLYLPGIDGLWMNNWTLTSNLFENLVKGVFPLVVAILFVIRRYADKSRFTIGSLSLDQFAAVSGIAAALAYVIEFANIINIAPALGLIGSAAIILGTSLSRYVGLFRKDFVPSDRALLSSDVVLTEARPRAPKPSSAPQESVTTYDDAAHLPAAAAATSAVSRETDATDSAPVETAGPEPIRPEPVTPEAVRAESASIESAASKSERTESARTEPARKESSREESMKEEDEVEEFGHVASADRHDDETSAFWFAVPSERHAVDPNTGQQLFALEPGSWILALEDRGQEFVVQHTDGKIGVLRDLRDVERG
ncbi:hypothetical protein ACXA45_07510 [Neomicrococcus lactis]